MHHRTDRTAPHSTTQEALLTLWTYLTSVWGGNSPVLFVERLNYCDPALSVIFTLQFVLLGQMWHSSQDNFCISCARVQFILFSWLWRSASTMARQARHARGWALVSSVVVLIMLLLEIFRSPIKFCFLLLALSHFTLSTNVCSFSWNLFLVDTFLFSLVFSGVVSEFLSYWMVLKWRESAP